MIRRVYLESIKYPASTFHDIVSTMLKYLCTKTRPATAVHYSQVPPQYWCVFKAADLSWSMWVCHYAPIEKWHSNTGLSSPLRCPGVTSARWGRIKVADILQRTYSYAFYGMGNLVFWFKFHLSVLTFATDNKSALIPVMSWCRAGAKPFSDPMMTWCTDAYMHHSVPMC